MHWLELKIPPPILAAVTALLMWLACGEREALLSAPLRKGLCAAFAVVGIALALAGILAFRHARTTPNPHRPDEASTLVVAGIYRYLRNPMYSGLVFVLLAWALWLAVPIVMPGPPLFMAYITFFQIMPEERALARKFGAAYAAYCARTRRWF